MTTRAGTNGSSQGNLRGRGLSEAPVPRALVIHGEFLAQLVTSYHRRGDPVILCVYRGVGREQGLGTVMQQWQISAVGNGFAGEKNILASDSFHQGSLHSRTFQNWYQPAF